MLPGMEASEGDRGGVLNQHSSLSNEGSESASRSSDYSESESGSQTEREASKEEEPVYEDVHLEPLTNPFLKSALEDKDAELWLVRMPRHDALRSGVVGGEIQVADLGEEQSSATRDMNAGHVKGYYEYRDHGVVDASMRATFVTRDPSGKAKLQVGKPFARAISITFDVPLRPLVSIEPPPRTYPTAPKGQKLKYYPIGSSRGKATVSTPAPTAKITASPVKRRKLSGGKERTSPRSTRSHVASDSQADAQSQPMTVNGKHAVKPEKVVVARGPSKRKRRINIGAT